MKVVKEKIPMFNWDLHIIEIESELDLPNLKKVFKKANMSDSFFEVEKEVLEGFYNGGATYFNSSQREMLIFIQETSSKERRFNVFMHEKRHAEDIILRHENVNCDEMSALFAGYLGELMFKIL